MTLDEAWAEAEAAVPEDGVLALRRHTKGTGYRATFMPISGGSFVLPEVTGPTPAAALHELAAKLRTREGGESR